MDAKRQLKRLLVGLGWFLLLCAVQPPQPRQDPLYGIKLIMAILGIALIYFNWHRKPKIATD